MIAVAQSCPVFSVGQLAAAPRATIVAALGEGSAFGADPIQPAGRIAALSLGVRAALGFVASAGGRGFVQGLSPPCR
jgi:hypothetical protein